MSCRSIMLLAAWLILTITVVRNSEAAAVCGKEGVRQSPIDIDISTVIPRTAPLLEWSLNFQENLDEAYLLNDGHSLRFLANTSEPLTISGGLLPTTYEFQQLHFHWGDNDTKGSEHTIMSHSYPIEMHVVFSQSESNRSDQFVVVGYFFRLSRRDNPGLTNLLDLALSAAQHPNEAFPVKPFRLSELVQITPFSYYSYSGSLTTPPYTESVHWIVASTALPISARQLKIFREAALLDRGLHNNYRCTQDLNGRQIHFIVPLISP
ncbi:hypothetical protein ILUMI_03234 [Ignelater luminosus]|uniref:Carbonic anhydrase n=1 Tax=Ignelater luminosus TaxID=2038154 RepID=A0A8K0DBY2_IGNLU|nr:hypothetical protein ILUMI_03234 [Ignelater luminosus]